MPLGRHEDIARLHVAVRPSGRRQGLERLGHLPRDPEGDAGLQTRSTAQHLGQCCATEPRHHHVARRCIHRRRQEGNQMGMRHAAAHFDLAAQQGNRSRIVLPGRSKHFQRVGPGEIGRCALGMRSIDGRQRSLGAEIDQLPLPHARQRYRRYATARGRGRAVDLQAGLIHFPRRQGENVAREALSVVHRPHAAHQLNPAAGRGESFVEGRIATNVAIVTDGRAVPTFGWTWYEEPIPELPGKGSAAGGIR